MKLKHFQFLFAVLFSFVVIGNTIVINETKAGTPDNRTTPTFSLSAISPAKEGRLTFINVEPGTEVDGMMVLSLMENDIEASFRLDRELITTIAKSSSDPKEWISFPENPKNLILKNKASANIPVKIKVPKGTAPGDYNFQISAIMEDYGKSLSKKMEIEQKNNPSGGGVTIGAKVNFGSGIQAYIRVKGDIKLSASLNNVKYEINKDGGLKFTIDCKNNSTVSIIPIAKIRIYDTIRKKSVFDSVYDLAATEPNGGCGGDIVIENKSINQQPAPAFKLAYGTYEANVSLEYIMLNFLTPREQMPVNKAGEAFLKMYHLPIRLIISIVITLVTLIIFVSYRSYRRKKLLSTCKQYMVQNNDTLDTVSNKFKVNPKIIVELNKIKFPFTLIPGTKILVPFRK